MNDILEVQDILPESILYSRLLKTLPFLAGTRIFNATQYFWFDRTSDIPDNSTISERFLPKCSQVLEIIDKNCIAVQVEKIPYANETFYRRCIAQSNECSIQSAMPVCVDKHIEINSTIISQLQADISSETILDYSCGNDSDYHFVDEYCYKIYYQETDWNAAKAECEKDDAMLFVPEKPISLEIIKSLFLHKSSSRSSGDAHVGVMYDLQNRTTLEYITANEKSIKIIPDSNVIYDLCEKTFHDRYTTLMSSSSLSSQEKTNLKKQQIGCAYIDLLSYTVPVIRCDEIPCNRTATVICQKLPIIKTDVIEAQRLVENHLILFL